MSSPTRVTVVCTGTGKGHRRHVFNTVSIGVGVEVNTLREVNMPDLAGQVVDGTALPGKAVVRAYDPRHGRHGWRWVCPVCGIDRRFDSDDRVRAWLASRGRVADIAQRA